MHLLLSEVKSLVYLPRTQQLSHNTPEWKKASGRSDEGSRKVRVLIFVHILNPNFMVEILELNYFYLYMQKPK